MTVKQTSPIGRQVVVASGRLQWALDGEVLVAGAYRIQLQGPKQWVTTFRGKVLRVDARRSLAIAWTEHHHRELLRLRRIIVSGLSAGAALMAGILGAHWMSTPIGYFIFAVSAGVFVGSLARFIAALSRNLLDPYRIREPWERHDWWSR